MLKETYYSRLSANEKKVYFEIVKGLQKRKTRIKISSNPSNELPYSILNDHPELFYWDYTKWQVEDSLFGKYMLLNYAYPEALSNELDARAENIAKVICNGDEESTVRAIHNYLIKTVTYDHNNMLDKENHSIVGPLINSKGVCEGISRTFQFLLNKCGIDCAVIEGVLEGENHMWNVVSINGYNYHIDVTSDIGLTEKRWKKPSYFYYMLTDDEIKNTHKYKDNFGCFQTKDNPFYKNGRVFNNQYELERFLSSVPTRQRLINFKYIGNLTEDEIYYIGCKSIRMGLFSSYLTFKTNANTYYFYR